MTKSGPTRRIAIAALVLALAPTAAFAKSFWVSSAGGRHCTHTTLQAAIDEAQNVADDDAIFLVGGGPFTGPFWIVRGGITIVGGVPSCGATNSTTYSTLLSPSGQRPLSILLGERGKITLQRLVITTQFGTVKGNGGGIWFVAPFLSELVVDDSQVVANGTLKDGGGIFVSGGILRLTGNSLVSSNTAVNGGGIAGLDHATVSINDSHVAANTAYFDGGGIYAPDAAVRIGEPGGLGLLSAVANNIAGDDGGGLYVGEGADSALLGTTAPLAITGNQARRGGGIFLNKAGMRLHRVEIDLNLATEEGGGIYLLSGARLATAPIESPPDGFPRFAGNRAREGAALFADGGGTWVGLRAGRFRDHDTVKDGAAVVAASGNASLYFRGITVFGNQAPELFAVEGGAALALLHTSIATNDVDRLVRWDGSGPGVQVLASAFSETEPFFSGLPTPQVLPQLTCIVSHFESLLQGMPPGTDLAQVLVADPEFLDPEDGDLHLWPGSPAVDLCPYADGGIDVNGGLDLDGDFRGFDNPFHPNPAGQTYDAGVDEVVGNDF